MPDDVVVLRTFTNELEAELAASVLEANGIPSHVQADNVGGAIPSLALIYPVRLLVRQDDEALAREILDTPAASPPDEDDAQA